MVDRVRFEEPVGSDWEGDGRSGGHVVPSSFYFLCGGSKPIAGKRKRKKGGSFGK